MTTKDLPAGLGFTAGLTTEQIEKAASTTDGTAITSRMLLFCLKMDSAQMIAAWQSEPDAFFELFQNAPAAIEKAKSIAELLDASYARLMLTGEYAGK